MFVFETYTDILENRETITADIVGSFVILELNRNTCQGILFSHL